MRSLKILCFQQASFFSFYLFVDRVGLLRTNLVFIVFKHFPKYWGWEAMKSAKLQRFSRKPLKRLKSGWSCQNCRGVSCCNDVLLRSEFLRRTGLEPSPFIVDVISSQPWIGMWRSMIWARNSGAEVEDLDRNDSIPKEYSNGIHCPEVKNCAM